MINDHIGFVDVVVIGDASGRGARAYERRGRRFARSASPDEVLAGDVQWRVTESALVGPGGESLPAFLAMLLTGSPGLVTLRTLCSVAGLRNGVSSTLGANCTG